VSRKLKILIVVFLALPELIGTGFWLADRHRNQVNERQTRENLHTIQLAVERYAVDSKFIEYPLQVNDELIRRYLAEGWPTNPYTGSPVSEVKAGEPGRAGDFSYLAVGQELWPGYTTGVGYVLVGYSRQGGQTQPDHLLYDRDLNKQLMPEAAKLDWRHVCIHLECGDSIPADAYLRRQLIREAPGLPRESHD
jgi:hypothetical protein